MRNSCLHCICFEKDECCMYAGFFASWECDLFCVRDPSLFISLNVWVCVFWDERCSTLFLLLLNNEITINPCFNLFFRYCSLLSAPDFYMLHCKLCFHSNAHSNIAGIQHVYITFNFILLFGSCSLFLLCVFVGGCDRSMPLWIRCRSCAFKMWRSFIIHFYFVIFVFVNGLFEYKAIANSGTFR